MPRRDRVLARSRRVRGRSVRLAVVLVGLPAASAAALLLLAPALDVISFMIGGTLIALTGGVIIAIWLEPVVRAGRLSRRRELERERRERRRSTRTRRAVHAAERRLFSQLEALLWLRDTLPLAGPLPPTRGAATAPDLLLELVRIIDRTRPASVLELGSGVSTIVMAARLKALGGGRLVSLEHSREYAGTTTEQLRQQDLDALAVVVHAPLLDVRTGHGTWSWYRVSPNELPETIDLLFVDGPPATTGRHARYPALPMLADRLAPGATIILDDTRRADEQEIVRRWCEEVHGLDVRELPLAKGAAIMTMPR